MDKYSLRVIGRVWPGSSRGEWGEVVPCARELRRCRLLCGAAGVCGGRPGRAKPAAAAPRPDAARDEGPFLENRFF